MVIGALAACGDDSIGSSGSPIRDGGGSGPDSSTLAVEVVACPATPDATITTVDGVLQYMPVSTTVHRGEIVRFHTSSTHNVTPRPGMADPALVVGFTQSKCFRFGQTGTHTFYC